MSDLQGTSVSLLIRGGRVIDPAENTDSVRDLRIVGGRIVADLPGPPDRTIDAAGLVVCPGFVEPHAIAPAAGVEVRFARQALAGGYTTVAAFGTARRARDYAGVLPRLRWIAPLTVPGTRRLAELGDAATAGAVAFGDGTEPHGDAEVLRRGLLYAAMLGKPVFDRPRDPELSEGGVAADGPVAARSGLFAIPVAAETVALRRSLTLAAATGGRLHATALSSADAADEFDLELDRDRDRMPSYAVTAAHLCCTDEALEGFDPAGRVDPPFRSADDRDALRAAVRSAAALRGNLLTAISSGHRPDPELLDPVDLLAAPPGFEAFETAFAAAFTGLADHAGQRDDVPLAGLIRLMTVGPAALLGVRLPTLAVGAPADVAVLDPNARWSCDAATLAVPVARTPLAGRRLRGRVTHTILGGRVVFDRGAFPDLTATEPSAGGRPTG